MREELTATNGQDHGPQEVMFAVYRHDTHKLTGQPHDSASETYTGVPVNRPVPHGADGDAAGLSRSPGQPEQTVANHRTRYRLSLIDGESRYDRHPSGKLENAVRGLVTRVKPEAMHQA